MVKHKFIIFGITEVLENTYFLAENMKEIISTIAPFFNIMPNGKTFFFIVINK
jgi:hypothetical protein